VAQGQLEHYYCMKIKQKGKQVTIDILLDNETAYHTDYTAIQRVSLNELVFTHDHSISSVIGSTHFNTLCGDFRSIDFKKFPSTYRPTTT